MNILLINHYAGSPRHGMEFRPFYLAREWVAVGHKVKIVAGSYSHIRAKQPDMPESGVAREQIDGIDYCWYPTPSYLGNGLGRVKSMLSFMGKLWSRARHIALDFKPDLVIASSTYPMDIWPAKKIADFAGAQLVYEVHDLWPLSPIELGGMPRWHPFIMWVQWAEDYAYAHADCVVSMLPKTLDYMVSRGLGPGKWGYVPNGVDLAEWQSPVELPGDVQNAIKSMKIRGLPIVGYAGTLGLANALDVLLDAAVLLKGRAQVLLVGTGPESARLLKRVEREGIDNVTMLPSVPKATIPNLLAQIDIAYIGLMPEPLFRFGISPNKLFDYMMAGKPVIQAIAAGNDLVSEVGCGLTVPPGQVQEVVRAISVLSGMSEQQRFDMGNKGHQFVMKHRLYPKLAQDFVNIVTAKLQKLDGGVQQ